MTGRRMYDKFCDALKSRKTSSWVDLGQVDFEPKAWPFLVEGERRVWNELARRVR